MLTDKTTKSFKPRKSSPRLKIFDYKGNYCYFITCCTHQSKPYFKDKNLVNAVLNTLQGIARKETFTILSYCFMPDHLHLLLSGEETSSFKDKNLVNAVLNTLQGIARKETFTILSYCFMPDHLHLLLSGEETSSLKDFMRNFKQKSSFRFRKISKKTLWQR